MYKKSYLKSFLLSFLTILSLFTSNIYGAGSSFSSSGSRSSSSSISKPSSSFSSSKPSAIPSSPPKSVFSAPSKPNSNPVSVAPPVSSSNTENYFKSNTPNNVDKNISISKSSAPPPSKAALITQSKQDNAAKYTTKFDSEPPTRPSYIPPVYRSGNTNYDINYSTIHGSYGFYNSLGAFILYDALSDAANRHATSTVNNYYQDGALVSTSSHSSVGGFFLGLFKLILWAGFISLIVYGVIWGVSKYNKRYR